MPLDTSDTVTISQLYALYNTAIDTGDGKTFANCFTPDGHFNSGHSVHDGREDIAEFAIQTHKALPGMRHNATNVLIEGEGDQATGSAFLIGYNTDGGYKVIVTGRYRDELKRTSDGWRFTKRIFTMDK